MKIHSGGQSFFAAKALDGDSLSERFAHWLLDQHGCAIRQLRQHRENGAGRHSHVEDAALRQLRQSFGNVAENMRHIKLSGQCAGLGPVGIDQRKDRKSSLSVGRQMGVVHDAAGANRNNRARRELERRFNLGWRWVADGSR